MKNGIPYCEYVIPMWGLNGLGLLHLRSLGVEPESITLLVHLVCYLFELDLLTSGSIFLYLYADILLMIFQGIKLDQLMSSWRTVIWRWVLFMLELSIEFISLMLLLFEQSLMTVSSYVCSWKVNMKLLKLLLMLLTVIRKRL